MVASGTTSRQLDSERDAHSIGYGAMILEGALAVVVILCCVSAAGFSEDEWAAKYSGNWVGGSGLIARIRGFIGGGAAFISEGFALVGIGGATLIAFLETVITVVIISFAATTMDSATRIQRYVVTELGDAVGWPAVRRPHVATLLAVTTAAALAILVQAPGKGFGSGGLILWPIFGVTNQLLACLTFLILNTWLAKRGKPVIYTLLPMLFLIVTVSIAGVAELRRHAAHLPGSWHLVAILGIGLALEAWMVVEGFAALRLSRRVRAQLAERTITEENARLALAGPTGATIGADGVIQGGATTPKMPDGKVC